jgi:hypothetical protein
MGGLGGDNMSIIIICFLHGKPWQNLVDKCKRISSEKKASSKLLEPAFSAFDRFTADGPFAEVSVLKTSDDLHANESSSSSHTSSPSSSSPISTEEKFELIAESSTSQVIVSETKMESETKNEEEQPKKIVEVESQGEEIAVSKTASEDILEPTTTTTTTSTDDAIVSNGD